VIKTFQDLVVYQKSYQLALELFRLTASFPHDERHGLTDQIRRASRSIPVNIVEGWAKRQYVNVLKQHLLDAGGSCAEMTVWLSFAKDCGYLAPRDHARISAQYEEIAKMLAGLQAKWKTTERRVVRG
jgi:four helix bundle protein